jgi:hypothetical protein
MGVILHNIASRWAETLFLKIAFFGERKKI